MFIVVGCLVPSLREGEAITADRSGQSSRTVVDLPYGFVDESGLEVELLLVDAAEPAVGVDSGHHVVEVCALLALAHFELVSFAVPGRARADVIQLLVFDGDFHAVDGDGGGGLDGFDSQVRSGLDLVAAPALGLFTELSAELLPVDVVADVIRHPM